MSTKPKLDDQTQAALSAIEEALKSTPVTGEPRLPEATSDVIAVRRPATDKGRNGNPAASPKTVTQRQPPAPRQPTQSSTPADPSPQKIALAPTPAANDDREEIGTLLQTMQARPSSRPILIAALASLLWIIAIGALAWSRLDLGGIGNQATLIERVETPGFGLAVALLFGPVIFFFALAGLFRRSTELRLTARSLSGIAFRLADPQVSAQDAIVTVSQAIRREVVAMNDGIERAMGRATELESLVHREISTLERAYSENEIRIRSLIDELITQREGISTHSERVRDVIADTHIKLSTELSAATAKLTGSLDETGSRVVEALHVRSELVTSALGQAGERIMAEIGTRGTDLTERLLSATESVGRQLSASGEAITSDMERRSKDVTERLGAITGEIALEIVTRGEAVTRHLDETGTRVTQQVAQVGAELTSSLDRTSSEVATRLDDTSTRVTQQVAQVGAELTSSLERASGNVVARLDETGTSLVAHIDRIGGDVQESLASTGTILANALNEGAGAVNDRLADTGKAILEGLGARASEVREDLRNVGEAIVTDLGARVSEVTQRLDETGHRITYSIVDGGEALAQRLAATGDRIEEAVTGRGGALESRLGALAEQVSAVMSERTAQAEAVFAEHSNRLSTTFIDRSEEMRGALEQHAASVEARLRETGDSVSNAVAAESAKAADIFATHSRELTQGFERQTDELETRLRDTSAVAANSVAAETAKAADILATHSRELTQGFERQTDELETRLRDTSAVVANSVATEAARASDLLAAHSRDLAQTFDGRASALHDALADHLASFENTIVVRGGSLADKIAADATIFTDIVSSKLGSIETLLTTHGDGLIGRLSSHTRQSAETMERQLAAFEERASAKTGEVTGSLDGMIERLASHTRQSAEAMERQVAAFEERASVKTGEVTSSLDGVIERIDGTLQKHAGVFTDGLRARTIEVARAIAESGRSASAQLEATMTEAGNAISDKAAFLAERAEEINGLLVTRSSEVAGALDAGVARFQDEVVGKLEAVSGALRTRTDQIHAQLGDRAVEIADLFDDQARRLSATTDEKIGLLGGHVANLTQSLDRQVGQLSQNVEGQLQLLDGRVGELSRTFDQQVHQMSERVDSRLDLLGGRAVELADAMDRQIDRLTTTVDGKLDEMSGVLSTRTNEVSVLLGARATELAGAFEAQIGNFDTKVSNRIEGLSIAFGERGEEIARLIGGTGTTLTENLTQRLIAIKVDIERASATAAQTLDRGASVLAASFEGGVREFSDSVARSSAELRGSVDDSTRHSIDALANAHETVRGEISGILDRLSAANGLLQQIMSGAGQSLGALEAGLAKRLKDLEYLLGGIVSETNRAASRVADQVGALNSVSSSTLRNAETLLEKLEGQAHSLAEATEAQTRGWNEAADLLERVEARIARSLTSKRDALESLTAAIGGRSEELDKVTMAFRAMVEDSLNVAEDKARRIGEVLSENSRASAAAIGDQFARIRETTGAERDRTAAVLRDAYETVVGDMNETLGQATGRFREAAVEMRAITTQIQREMEATRAELHRGLVELPRETQASAGEMRRVVGEQIKVLNELTAMATRSATSFDAAEPAVSTTLPPREVRQIQAATVSPSRSMPAARPGMAEASPPRRPAPAAYAPMPSAATLRDRRPEVESRPDESGRGGWLTDLLTRASREEPLPGPANRPQPASIPAPQASRSAPLASLDTIAVDIARMIDHEAAAETWDRYQRGEQHVFSRAVYTPEGQQMYDEIRRKYRRDQEFKETADRYIEEFERLLSDVARDPATQRGYLTSDTGKVYTILAHAAGRLE